MSSGIRVSHDVMVFGHTNLFIFFTGASNFKEILPLWP